MSTRPLLSLALLLVAAIDNSYSQENLDWRYRVSADGHYMNGNIRRWYANTRFTITVSDRLLSVSLAPSLLYGQSGKIVFDRDMLVTLSTQFRPQDLFFGYAVTTYDFSRRNKIESRWQSGAGTGINVLQLPEHGLSITNAMVYENTRFNVIEGNETWRMSVRLKGFHEFFNRAVILNHETYFQPSIERFSDLRWRTTVSLDFPVTKALSFRTAIDNNHESVVLTGRKQDDLRWTFGVSVGN